MRTLTIGDIHGRYNALKEVLDKSKFNYDKDKLIVLGDIVDGGINTYKVIEKLLKIKNVVFVRGNHDEFWMNHITNGWAESIWINQGGSETIKSYGGKAIPGDSLNDKPKLLDIRGINIPVTHQDFFNKSKLWHIENDMLFVHGGINPKVPIEGQRKFDLLWDRDLIKYAKKHPIPPYKKVFIGHTTTQNIDGGLLPVKLNNLICLDTGAGWNGKLTIMDIKTEKYWQSEVQKPCQ